MMVIHFNKEELDKLRAQAAKIYPKGAIANIKQQVWYDCASDYEAVVKRQRRDINALKSALNLILRNTPEDGIIMWSDRKFAENILLRIE